MSEADQNSGSPVDPARLRNTGIVAHINAGKTTLTERILFDTGRQPWMGEVDQGTAAMDWMAEEQDRGISITAAATRVGWGGYAINLVDTPGHVDFTGEVGRCLRILDGVVVVLDAVRGVESQTETVWVQADDWCLPRVVFVNKLDRATADVDACLAALRDRFGARPLSLHVPVHQGGVWIGILDVLRGEFVARTEGAPTPVLDPEWVAAQREAVVDAVSQWHEPVLSAFVDGRPVSDEMLMRGIRAGCIRGECVPVVTGSALENIGVRELLDAVCSYLPGPGDAREVRSRARALAPGDAAEPEPDPAAPVSALVFKVQRIEGCLLYFARVFAGVLRRGDTVACAARSIEVAVDDLWLLHAGERVPARVAGPGDIVALGTSARLRTGDTLHSIGAPLQLERTVFPRPVLQVRMEPLTGDIQQVLGEQALVLEEEDPTLEVRIEDGGGVVIAGMGELHLEIVRERLERAVGAPVRMGRPSVAKFETIELAAEATVEARGLVGGVECGARAHVEVRPAPGRGDARLVPTRPAGPDDLPWGELAADLEVALAAGLHAPHPALDLDLRVVRLEGTAPLPQGSGLFAQAVLLAARKAVAAAQPRLLEPEVRVEVSCPAGVLASVLRDLRARGIELDGVASGVMGGRASGRAPLARLLGYATRLRSVSKGQAVLSLSPHGFVAGDPS